MVRFLIAIPDADTRKDAQGCVVDRTETQCGIKGCDLDWAYDAAIWDERLHVTIIIGLCKDHAPEYCAVAALLLR